MPPEVQLALLAIVLYLYDSSLLLYANQGVLTLGRGKRWRISVGSDDFLLMRRSLFVANPFAPQAPLVRLGWQFDQPPGDRGARAWRDLMVSLRRAAPLTILAGIALFGLIPLGLVVPLGLRFVLASIALLYVSIAFALAVIYPACAAAGMGGRRFAAQAFECLACPPFGVNMIRRISLAYPLSDDLVETARELLPEADWMEFRAKCIERLREAIEDEPVGTPRAQRLHETLKARFDYEEPR